MSRIARVFEQHVRKGMSSGYLAKQTSIEHQILERSKVIDVAPGYVKTHYQLDSVNDVNPMGFVHGGVTATLVDSITTWCCFASRDGHAGVTTDLSISYLKGIDPKVPFLICITKMINHKFLFRNIQPSLLSAVSIKPVVNSRFATGRCAVLMRKFCLQRENRPKPWCQVRARWLCRIWHYRVWLMRKTGKREKNI